MLDWNLQYVPAHKNKNFDFAICVVDQMGFEELKFVSKKTWRWLELFSPSHQYDMTSDTSVLTICGTT